MKYIKLFENIDWTFIEEEEEEKLPKIGDFVFMNNFYFLNRGEFEKYKGSDLNKRHEIVDIKKSEDVENDTYGKGVSKIYNGYLYRIKGKWPWYKID